MRGSRAFWAVALLSVLCALAPAAPALAEEPPEPAPVVEAPPPVQPPPPAEPVVQPVPAAAPPAQGPPPALPYLTLAEQGVARAERTWRDSRRGWYDEHLNDHEATPLATIWGIVPLFEALDAIDAAAPSAAHRASVLAFARGAESYWNYRLTPMAGFAPYPHDRGPKIRTWFDDNGWWGLAFMDAFKATGEGRLLGDAERAFSFIAAQGWDAHGGGIWWNTWHPYKAGEALAAASLLGAELYERTHRAFYLSEVQKFLGWADAHFLTEYRLYDRTDSDSTPTPYIEGPLVEAHEILCKQGQQAACARARELASACWQRFEARLEMGPQFDTIYLHWMLVYASQTGDPRWPLLARQMAANAQAHARNGSGLYMRAWDGSDITMHEARPNMLQTDAATLELFAWLAATHG